MTDARTVVQSVSRGSQYAHYPSQVRIASSDDRREREADSVALAAGASAGHLRSISASPPPSHIVAAAAQAVSFGGSPLSSADRAYFEPRLGADLQQIRIHNDAGAASASDAIGARAFTVGNHIGFARDEFSRSRPEGRSLLAHELAHAVTAKGSTDTIFRKEKAKVPTAEEAETALGTLLRAYPSGMKLAFYDENEPEAERRAKDFAAREQTLGFTGKKPTARTIEVGKAISGVFDIDTTVTQMTDIATAALARVPPAPGVPAGSANAPAQIQTLAIFAHGTSNWCSIGVTTSNAGKIFKAIAPKLSTSVAVNIILYTCSSARGSDEDESWQSGTLDPGGKGSLAEKVRDTLADEKITSASVWGHTTVGHVSRNFALRVFETADGKGAQGKSFASTYVFDAKLRDAALKDVIDAITATGFTVDTTSKAFATAVGRQLREQFYAAYAEANAKLPDDNPAEDAPVYRYLTSSRISEYWKNTYWPREKAKAAQSLVKSLKLKKPKPPAK